MADLFQILIKQCPAARGEISPEWGSDHAGSRLLIRRAITVALGGDSLEDLSLPPKLPDWNISISHTHDLGGWVATPRLYSIGFDIEIRDRLKREILERISVKSERQAAPDPVFLWVAKEACFKSLVGPSQPKTISEIEIGNWEPRFSLWSFSSKQSPGRGWVATDSNRVYALFVR